MYKLPTPQHQQYLMLRAALNNRGKYIDQVVNCWGFTGETEELQALLQNLILVNRRPSKLAIKQLIFRKYKYLIPLYRKCSTYFGSGQLPEKTFQKAMLELIDFTQLEVERQLAEPPDQVPQKDQGFSTAWEALEKTVEKPVESPKPKTKVPPIALDKDPSPKDQGFSTAWEALDHPKKIKGKL